MRNRQAEAANRFAERRRREDEAPRLVDVVPTLESLRLEISEFRPGAAIAEAKHIRPVVVARAPALFFVPCREPSCIEGGHDLTREVMERLRSRNDQFEGEDPCEGRVGTVACRRVLRYVATATYRR